MAAESHMLTQKHKYINHDQASDILHFSLWRVKKLQCNRLEARHTTHLIS